MPSAFIPTYLPRTRPLKFSLTYQYLFYIPIAIFSKTHDSVFCSVFVSCCDLWWLLWICMKEGQPPYSADPKQLRPSDWVEAHQIESFYCHMKTKTPVLFWSRTRPHPSALLSAHKWSPMERLRGSEKMKGEGKVKIYEAYTSVPTGPDYYLELPYQTSQNEHYWV